MGMVVVFAFGYRDAAHRGDGCDPTADQIGCKFWQSFIMIFRPTIFYADVTAFDVTSLTQASLECSHRVSERTERLNTEKSDYRHRRLQRTRRKWQCEGHTAEEHDEFTSLRVLPKRTTPWVAES
jgi:hypothetical protein